MDLSILIWIGSAVTVLGLFGLFWCIKEAATLKRDKPSDDEIRRRLQRLVPVNIGSVGIAFIGLMLVVLGLML